MPKSKTDRFTPCSYNETTSYQVGFAATLASAIWEPTMSKRRHVFISHHHADDALVDSLTKLLSGRGFEIRNSSIRAKPANQDRLDKGMVKEATIRRLLRMKMSWASTVVVLIGKETHSRDWVNWEIEKANSLGKRIIGVYERGGTDFEIPPMLDEHATKGLFR